MHRFSGLPQLSAQLYLQAGTVDPLRVRDGGNIRYYFRVLG
jgi:hypothetical protein